MKKRVLALVLFGALLTGCGNTADQSSSVQEKQEVTEAATETVKEQETTSAESETEHATAPQEEVGYEGMKAVDASMLNDGEYDINVDSSS